MAVTPCVSRRAGRPPRCDRRPAPTAPAGGCGPSPSISTRSAPGIASAVARPPLGSTIVSASPCSTSAGTSSPPAPVHPRQVGAEHLAERRALVAHDLADVREREAEVAQRPDPVEPPHVALVLEPLLPLRPPRGREQPDLLVVVQRAHRQSGRLRQLTDPPGPPARPSRAHLFASYNLTPREVQAGSSPVTERDSRKRWRALPSRPQSTLLLPRAAGDLSYI